MDLKIQINFSHFKVRIFLLGIFSIKSQILIWIHYLTHCGPVTPQGIMDLGQHWHQAITWTNVDLSSVWSIDIHMRAISQEIPQPLVTKSSLKSPRPQWVKTVSLFYQKLIITVGIKLKYDPNISFSIRIFSVVASSPIKQGFICLCLSVHLHASLIFFCHVPII